MVNETASHLAKILSNQLSQDELIAIATQAVKRGNAPLADTAFSRITSDEPILKLYKGRLLSLKGEFHNFIDYSSAFSGIIQKECHFSDPLSPWYWREGIAYTILNQYANSENSFAKMRDMTNNSEHEMAHYFQCYGAVKLFIGQQKDRAQDLLTDSITMYLKGANSDEPYYSLFDSFRCIIVNLIMQSILDLQSGKTHIAYRKLLYCREWVKANSFSKTATGISEISTLFSNGDYGWVFDFIFSNENKLIDFFEGKIDSNIMFLVTREGLDFQSLKSKTVESAMKSFSSDYLTMNNYPKEKFRKYFMIHLEAVSMKKNKVFIIYGRNKRAYKEFITFLTALRLDPVEWDEAIRLTHKASPYIGEIIEAGFNEAQAIIVLLTPDEKVELLESYCQEESDKEVRYQSRANVIFEAGYALAKYPQQTILVQMGKQSLWSDISGLHIMRISNDAGDRNALVNRLMIAGCPIETSTSSLWITQGDLNA